MRRRVGWIGGAASAIFAYRFWRRHRPSAVGDEPEAAAEADARAEELRAKLAEARAREPAVEESPARESAVDEGPAEQAEDPPHEPSSEAPEAESIDERRRRVHDEGRATIDEMRPE
jgi:hypothetical protein